MSDARDIKGRLLNQVESVCRHLLPEGEVKGHEYRTGDVSGGSGKSLAVELRGNKRGVWKDFASGESGDILSLWMESRSIKFKEALGEARRFLGITNIDRPAPQKKPNKPSTAGLVRIDHSPGLKYLQEKREIHPETATFYKVFSHFKNNVRADKYGTYPDYLFAANETFLVFCYIDPEGDPVMLKSTGLNKKSDGGKDIWTTKPWYTLWGWWTVRDNDREIIITEGEIDTLTVYQMGAGMPVLSVPAGAANLHWIENDYHALQRFEKIYLLTDNDEAGNKAASEIAKRLGRARCARIPLPGKHKDANDVLVNGEPEETEIHEWIQNAVSFDPPTLQTANDYRQKVHAALIRDKEEETNRDFLFSTVPFQYRDGETTLLTGYAGHGKSEFLYQSHLFEMSKTRKVCIASLEIPPADMLLHLATQHLGKRPTPEELDESLDWMDGKLWFYQPPEKTDWEELIEDFVYCAQRFGVSRFVVDSLHFLCRKEDYEGQDNFTKALCIFSKAHNVHTTLVAHARIKQGEQHIARGDQVEGSGGMVKPIDNGLTVWRNIGKEEALEKADESQNPFKRIEAQNLHDGILTCWKQRGTGKYFRQKLWFDPHRRRFRTTKENHSMDPLPVEEPEEETIPF